MSAETRIIISARDMATSVVRRTELAVRRLTDRVFSLRTGFAALGAAALGRDLLMTSASFERLRISLDTITKGKGEETFQALNEWAKEMPLNTEQAIQSFVSLKAMGLDPTIQDMTTLVDTSSALGAGVDGFEGIARALGQIATKGKVSAEELMQLAERGVPAYEILRQKLNLTAEQVANIGNLGVDGNMAVQALLEGMAERFGGQSERIKTIWDGLWDRAVSTFRDFERKVGDSHAMSALETEFAGFLDYVDANEEALDSLAETMGTKLAEGTKSAAKGVKGIAGASAELFELYNRMPDDLKGPAGVGLAGGLLFGPKAGVVIAGGYHLVNVARNISRALEEIDAGNLTWSEFSGMNAEELSARIREMDAQRSRLEKSAKGLSLAELRKKDTPGLLKDRPLPRVSAASSFSLDTSKADAKAAEKAAKQAEKERKERLKGIQAEISERQRLHAIRAEGAQAQAQVAQMADELAKKNKEAAKEARLAASGFAEGWSKGLADFTSAATNAFEQTRGLAAQAFEGIRSSFSDVLLDGMSGKFKDWTDYFQSALDTMKRGLADFVSSQAMGSFLGLFASEAGGTSGGGSGGGIGAFFSNLFGSAKGNVLAGPGISALSGGVYSSPTFFGFDRHLTGFASGGVLAEAGPEAVLPLARTSGGALGVQAVGGGGDVFNFGDNYFDFRGADQSVVGQLTAVANQITSAAVRQAVTAVEQRQRRGRGAN